MIDLGFLKGQKIAVLGLSKSGLSAARALAGAGAVVLAWDDSAAARDAAAAEGIPIADLRSAELAGTECLVLSPGIRRGHPQPHPVVARCLAADVRLLNDIDLLGAAQSKARWLGVTGTNGKSTTTALIGHILRQAGIKVAVGGNLGTPALELAALGEDGWYVLELSSYQLETVSLIAWDIGAFLNITPDHLDRYESMADYVNTKRQLFHGQPNGATAVVGVDDEWGRSEYQMLASLRRRLNRRVVPISAAGVAEGGVYVRDGKLIDDLEGRASPILDLAEAPTLPGAHNAQNAAAAYAAARAAGAAPEAIAAAIRSFPGLAHRQELVAVRDGIRFINDSKATNADAAAKALACYRTIYWIAGGRPKVGGLDPLAPHLGRVAHAFLIGEATDMFARYLEGRRPYTRCGDLATAVAAAERMAWAGGTPDAVVLLSPACASFDQFANFEERGAAFAALVRTRTGGDA